MSMAMTTSLSQKIEQINNYLEDKIKQEPNDLDFFQQLRSIIIDRQQNKLKIKFVGQFSDLSEHLQQISQQKFAKQLSCQFQTVTDITNVDLIVRDCDLLCLVRDYHQKISQLDKQLINKASKANIGQVILNVQKIDKNKEAIAKKSSNTIHNWLNKQKYHHIQLFCLPLHFDGNNDLSRQIKDSSLIEQLLSSYESQLEIRRNKIITLRLSKLFAEKKKSIWHQIKQKQIELNNKKQNYQRQKSCSQQKNKAKQQNTVKKLKEKIIQEKINITNSFSYDSLIYKVSQLVDRSEANLFKENQQQYIHLILKEQDVSQRLSTVVINLCQEELANWVSKNWQEVDRVYELNYSDNYDELTQNEINSIQKLSLAPNFDLNNFVSLPLLNETSQTIFDYRFSDSGQFKLIVTIAFGIIIYFLTGRFFGFAVLIFQTINLFTGKDVKTQKLKQQTKELKRKSANQYQSLVRFLAERASSTLILALENRKQVEREQIDRLIEESEEQLDRLKCRISEHKERIENLKRDELEILSLLRQNSSSASQIDRSI